MGCTTNFARGEREYVRFDRAEILLHCSGRVVPVDRNQVCMCLPRCNDSEPLGSHMLDVLEHKVCFVWGKKGSGPYMLFR